MTKILTDIPLLSFCISTFNREEKIYNLVKEILKHESEEIEVVVSDNCSTDNTVSKLEEIDDPRFRFYLNEINIGAIQNYLRAMSEGRGRYIFFSTDKDFIQSPRIRELITFYKNNPDIIAGYCALDINKKKQNQIFSPGIQSLCNIGYLSKHPTGYFFRNDELSNLNLTDNYSQKEKVGSFPFEFILADLSMKGKTAIINIPLCYMETMEDVINIKSYSYSNEKGNLYFSPLQRYEMFEKYVTHIMSTELTNKERKKLVTKVFKNGLSCATVGYKNMVENKIVCAHYNTTYRRIGLIEILKIDYEFSKKFVKKCNYSTVLMRSIICFCVHLRYILRVKNILK